MRTQKEIMDEFDKYNNESIKKTRELSKLINEINGLAHAVTVLEQKEADGFAHAITILKNTIHDKQHQESQLVDEINISRAKVTILRAEGTAAEKREWEQGIDTLKS
jgi:UTP-glucose-1-phosphate uridylyltransferase